MLSLKIFLSKENNIKSKVSFYNKLRKKLQHCSVCWVQVVILFTLSTVYELFTRKNGKYLVIQLQNFALVSKLKAVHYKAVIHPQVFVQNVKSNALILIYVF